MGNQQSLPDGSPAPQTHNPTSSSPIRSRQHSNAATTSRAYYGAGAPTSPSASVVDPALLAEYQRLRKEILDDPAFSNDALLPFEDELPPEASSANLPTSSTPWSKPHASDIVSKPKGYREPDTSGYYDDSGTTFNDIVDTRKLPPPGPPSPPISASYSTRPRQAAAIGTSGASGYQVTGEARARSRAATDASVGSGAVGQARAAASPPMLPPGMPVRVNQNGDAVVDLVLEDGTPLQLRQAKRQFDRDKFKRANNQQAAGDTPLAPVQPSLSAALHKDDSPDPHTIPLPNSPLKPASTMLVSPQAGQPAGQPRGPSNGLSDMDEALMDDILRLV